MIAHDVAEALEHAADSLGAGCVAPAGWKPAGPTIDDIRQANRWFDEHTSVGASSIDCVLENEKAKGRHHATLLRLVNQLAALEAAAQGEQP